MYAVFRNQRGKKISEQNKKSSKTVILKKVLKCSSKINWMNKEDNMCVHNICRSELKTACFFEMKKALGEIGNS